jgi:hypothetical protein
MTEEIKYVDERCNYCRVVSGYDNLPIFEQCLKCLIYKNKKLMQVRKEKEREFNEVI